MRPHFTDPWDHNHAWPDRRIAELAARQATTVSTRQLRGLGVAPRTITSANARGRLHRVHHGVYSLVLARARPVLAAEWAALLACGPRALLSHLTAAWLQGLVEQRPRGSVTLTVVGADRRHPGIETHRVAELSTQERDRRSGLPVTSVARIVLEAAATMNHTPLTRLIDRALQRTSATRIREVAERHPGRRGSGRVVALLDPARPSTDTWSHGERRLLALIREAGLPLPECNIALGRNGYVADLLWRAQRVIVEYDTEDFHFGPGAFQADRTRHNTLVAQGFQVLHVTEDQLAERPAQVLAWIAAALARAEM